MPLITQATQTAPEIPHAAAAHAAPKAGPVIARKPQPMSPGEWKAHLRDEALRARAHAAAMAAGKAALGRGAGRAEVETAMREARERIMPSARALAPVTPPPAPSPLPGDSWTRDRKRAFLLHLAETGCVRQACAHAGLSRQSAYKLRHRVSHSVFALAWDVAIHLSRQALLDEATERALQGSEIPVWYRGEQVGTRIVHNDRLLMFLLARKREPLHPLLDAREMAALFPAMLDNVDADLPSPLTAERIAELRREALPETGYGDESEDEHGDGDEGEEGWEKDAFE